MSILSRSDIRGFRNINRTFSKGVQDSLNERRKESRTGKVTVFLSHKHDEVEELDGAISLLKSMGVYVYVDWEDDEMPKNTNGSTAIRIKRKIRENKKFILLATEAAIASKWCNWELGYGDSIKYMNHIAIFPLRNSYDNYYSGSEYLAIYPAIEYLDGNSKTVGGDYIPKGYYVLNPPDMNGSRTFKTLKKWLGS